MEHSLTGRQKGPLRMIGLPEGKDTFMVYPGIIHVYLLIDWLVLYPAFSSRTEERKNKGRSPWFTW